MSAGRDRERTTVALSALVPSTAFRPVFALSTEREHRALQKDRGGDPGTAAAAAGMDSDLEWIKEGAERGEVDAVQAALAAEFEGWPAAFPTDLTHDINVARFLRGHGGQASRAIPVMIGAVRYRSELFNEPAVRQMRETIGQGTFADPLHVPHFDELQDILPNRCVPGAAAGALPLSVSPIRQADLMMLADGANAERDAKFDLFFRCTLEQRALVLHNLSVAQRRMVKFYEVRDFNAVWISELMRHGQYLLSRVSTA